MDRFVLPPGFRFHPTDEELVSHYLRRKVCGRKFDIDAIGEVDLYNYEPWDLPDKSFLQTRDLEWYFFIPRDRKYPNGSRTNRATEKGYWKSTGKDRGISSGSRNVGTKKTLVYYNGRAPKGERTNWVMHEYRLNDAECQRVNASENGFVLCRIYQKSGAGPKNGEQYGAPVEDEEFDGLSLAGGDGSGSSKTGGFEGGPSNTNGHYDPSPTIDCSNEAVSQEKNKVHPSFRNAGIQPRNLKFEDSPGTITSDFVQMENVTNHDGMGRTIALRGYGGEDFVAPAILEEDGILRDLYKSLKSNACADQWNATEGNPGNTTYVGTGFYQTGAHPPSDGDFLELDDLLTVSDCEDGMGTAKLDNKQTNGGWKDFSNDLECTSAPQRQAVPSFPNMLHDCNGQWQDLQHLQESAQMQSSMSAVTYDSQHQPFRDNIESLIASSGLYHEELGIACQTDSNEPDFEEVLELFARAEEDKSFNVETFAESLQRGSFYSEENLILPSQEGQYYDAPLSFADVDMYGESRSAAGQTASNFGDPQVMPLMQAGLAGELASEMDGVLDKLAAERIYSIEHPDGGVELHEFRPESGLSLQGEEITLGQVKNPPSPLSILWSCLDSLPTLPASAADLSPKAITSGGSFHATATGVGVGIGAISMTCTCVGDDITSTCMNCSVHAEVMNAGRFVKSLSFKQRTNPTDKWRAGYYTSAVFAALGAIFWLFVAGDARKLFGGLYRKMIGSET